MSPIEAEEEPFTSRVEEDAGDFCGTLSTGTLIGLF